MSHTVQGASSKDGVCIVSFDSGGPGSISQVLAMRSLMNRLEFDLEVDEDTLCPADHFDLFGGAGYGAVSGVLLGPLKVTPKRAIDELAQMAREVFPNEPNVVMTPDANTEKLHTAVENMFRRCGMDTHIKLNDKRFTKSRCKTVVFVAEVNTIGHCHPLRAYRSRQGASPDCTLVDVVCAAIADPAMFSPIEIGPPSSQEKQKYAGIPIGYSNPIRSVLEEARLQLKNDTPVALILSLGAGQSAPISLHPSMSISTTGTEFLTRIVLNCENAAKEMTGQLSGVDAYLRLSVDQGLANLKLSDWYRLDAITSHTNVYLQSPPIPDKLDEAVELLTSRTGSLTLGEIGRANMTVAAKARFQQRDSDLALQMKEMRDIIQQSVVKITLIDAIGNPISIPTALCRTYEMLSDFVHFYFKHQSAPGSSFVRRNQYQLVHGPNRRTVDPTLWGAPIGPGTVIEMSIVMRRTRFRSDPRNCPRCQGLYAGHQKEGWVTWKVSPFLDLENVLIEVQYVLPKNHSISRRRAAMIVIRIHCSRDITDKIRDNDDGNNKIEVAAFRLLSVVESLRASTYS